MWYFIIIIISVVLFYIVLKNQLKVEPSIPKESLNVHVFKLAKERKLMKYPMNTTIQEVLNPSGISLNDYEILKKEILCKKN